MKKVKLVLALGLPRRIELLKMLGCKFQVIPNKVEEKVNPRLSRIENAKRGNFRQKNFRKGKNKKEAYRMLKNLSGKEHRVITGLAVVGLPLRVLNQILEKFDINLL